MTDKTDTSGTGAAPVSGVEEVVRYRSAIDGSEFHSREAAEAHDAEIRSKRKPLTELMKDRVDPRYYGVLMTFEAMLKKQGWTEGKAMCCGKPVNHVNWFGETAHAECDACGKWAVNVTAPSQDGACLYLVDPTKYDVDDPFRWIAGDAVQTLRERGE
jgi:hypothetical protein